MEDEQRPAVCPACAVEGAGWVEAYTPFDAQYLRSLRIVPPEALG